jgi:ketosteroid isomerase-like protein
MDGAPGSEVERVRAALEASLAAYEAASPEFFDYFTEDASFFSPSMPTRIDGRDAYRRYFGPQLGLQRRASHLLDLELRMLADGAALATFHNRIRVNYNCVDLRATMVLVRQGELWKIAHLHMSPLNRPAATDTTGLVEDITLVPASED